MQPQVQERWAHPLLMRNIFEEEVRSHVVVRTYWEEGEGCIVNFGPIFFFSLDKEKSLNHLAPSFNNPKP